MFKIIRKKTWNDQIKRIASLEQDMQMVRFRTGENNVAAERTQAQINFQHIEDMRQRREDAKLKETIKRNERDIKELKRQVETLKHKVK